MANITIKDASAVNRVIKTTEDGFSVHTKHVNVDACALPTGAATAAAQATMEGKIDDAIVELQSILAAVQGNGSWTQLNNFGSLLNQIDTEAGDPSDPVPLATNGAAVAITPALADPLKSIVIDHAQAFITGDGTDALVAGDVITISLLEETSNNVLARKEVTVLAASVFGNLNFYFDEVKGVKLETNKRVMLKVEGRDGSHAAQARDITGYVNIFYHEEL